MDVSGQAAIITGGGTGLGAAAAELLAEKGVKVALLGRRQEIVESQAAKIGGLGIACDVTNAEDTAAAFARAREAHGPARILLNAAGIVRMCPALDPDGEPTPLDLFEQVMHTNVVSAFNATRLAAAGMVRLDPLEDDERGVIINISSVAARDGSAGSGAYAASKAAVEALTMPLARELGAWGVRVVTIAPGPITTPMIEQAPEPFIKMLKESLVFPHRFGHAGEFAELVLHICNNILINGAVLRLDGAKRSDYRAPPRDP